MTLLPLPTPRSYDSRPVSVCHYCGRTVQGTCWAPQTGVCPFTRQPVDLVPSHFGMRLGQPDRESME